MRKSWPLSLLAAVLLSTIVFGQMFRLDLFKGSAGGLLISDAVALALALTLPVLYLSGKINRDLLPRDVKRWLFVWLVILVLSYLINCFGFGVEEKIVGLGYLIRLVAYLGVMIISYLVLPTATDRVVRYLAYVVVALIALGWVIFIVLPDFSILVPLGWDPHVGRMTSTWLDPNYFGCFLAMMFVFFLPLSKKTRENGNLAYSLYLLLLLSMWVSIFLSYSRSALVTFAVGALFVAFQMSWRTVVVVVLLIVSTFTVPSRMQSRLGDTVAFSLQKTGISTAPSPSAQPTGVPGSAQPTPIADPTGNARLLSWMRAIRVFEKSPVIGVGYNFYQYTQNKLGVYSHETVASNRSAAGSDSSILNLLATTGVLGVLAFLGFWYSIVRRLWHNRKNHICLGAMGMILSLFVSSFLNNTLLYALILMPVFVVIGLALATTTKVPEYESPLSLKQ